MPSLSTPTSAFQTLSILLTTLLTLTHRTLAQDVGNGNDILGIGHATQPPSSMPSSNDLLSSSDDEDDDSTSQSDNSRQYYLIILVVALLGLIGCFVLFISKRRQNQARAARARMVADMEASRGQRALVHERYWGADASEVSGPNGVWARGHHWGRGIPMVTRGAERLRRPERTEGLNERGEAPPPYTKTAKEEEEVLGEDGADKVPKYEEAVLERAGGSEEVARPEPVHQAGARL